MVGTFLLLDSHQNVAFYLVFLQLIIYSGYEMNLTAHSSIPASDAAAFIFLRIGSTR